MVMRPSTGRVRQQSDGTTTTTTRPPLGMPSGVSTPSPPSVTSPTMPPPVNIQAGSEVVIPNANEQQTDFEQRVDERRIEERRIYDGYVEAAENQIRNLGDPVIFEGRYFYESAPLGLEWAGRRMVVPLGINPQTGQYEFDDFFELDQATWVASRSRNVGDERNIQRGAEVAAATQMPLLDETGAERELNMLSTQDLQNVKIGLVQIGALDREDMGSLNTFDTQSNPQIQQAFQRLVGLAQNNMLDWRTMLSRMVRNNETVAPTKTQRAPLIRVTSVQDLRAVADNVATRTIGRALTDEEAQTFVTSYQNMERAYQRRALGGGEVQMAPDAQVAAQEQIEEQFATEYDVYQMGNYLDVFRAATRGQI